MARHVFWNIDPWLYPGDRRSLSNDHRRNGHGSVRQHRCQVGATRRQHQLTYFHDGSDPILIASNYGGAKHPQWYYNLKANPECEFGDEPFVATEVTDPDEYARLYGLAEQVYAG